MTDLDNVQIPFKFEEKLSARLLNVMPEITEKDLLSRIPGVTRMPDNRFPTDRQVFELQFQYGYGAGKGLLTMAPGEERNNIPKDLARELRPFLAELGVVVVQEGEDDVEARLRGLQDALSWLRSNGSDRYTDQIMRLGYNEEQEKRQRHNFKNSFIIMEKEAVVEEEIERLSSEGVVEEVAI